MGKKLLALALAHFWVVLVLVGIAVLGYLSIKSQHAKEAEIKARDEVIAQKAKELGFVQGQLQTQAALQKGLEGALAGYVAQLKKVDKGARLIETTKSTAEVTSTDAGHVTATVGQPSFWDDEHHRFHLELPNGPLYRHQEFKFDGAIVEGLDGKHRWFKSDLTELDPQTHEVIPAENIKYTFELQFGKDAAPPVKVFHPRAVVGIDWTGRVGAGAEVLNFKDRINLSLLGYYDRVTKKVAAAAQLGYRVRIPFADTNFSVGPFYDSSRKLGASVTLELTR